jgi:hypothetical protein
MLCWCSRSGGTQRHRQPLRAFRVRHTSRGMLQPKGTISLDSRYEATYPSGPLEEHVKFYKADQGLRFILHRYPTDAVPVRRGEPVEAALVAESAWRGRTKTMRTPIFACTGLACPWSTAAVSGLPTPFLLARLNRRLRSGAEEDHVLLVLEGELAVERAAEQRRARLAAVTTAGSTSCRQTICLSV